MKATKRFLLTLVAMISMTAAWAQTTEEEVTVTPVQGETNQWTFTMPASDVELEVEYYDEVTLNDVEDIRTPLYGKENKEVWVNYSRAFTTEKAATVCLPFDYQIKDGENFYEFTGINKVGTEYVADMTHTAGATLTANTPYLFVPSGTESTVDFSGLHTIAEEVEAGSVTQGDWKFAGYYYTFTWDNASTGLYGFAGEAQPGIELGQFVKIGTGVWIPPMRAMLVYKSGSQDWSGARRMGASPANEELPEYIRLRLFDANGEVTGIGTLETRTGELTLDGDWYTLDGTRLQAKPTAKGVYVNNGRKVVIK